MFAIVFQNTIAVTMQTPLVVNGSETSNFQKLNKIVLKSIVTVILNGCFLQWM